MKKYLLMMLAMLGLASTNSCNANKSVERKCDEIAAWMKYAYLQLFY